MLTAAEALRQSKERKDPKVIAEERIAEAIAKGETKCFFDEQILSKNKEFVEWLESFGYRTCIHSDYMGQGMILWN